MAGAKGEQLDESAYRRWLAGNTDLSGRSLGDLVSRTKRVIEMVDLRNAKDADQVEIALLGNASFKACSPTVRSQLRRAATLFVRFKRA